ncbi:CLK4-associating serine/arginine rich protein [Senna tora]|uniref:CLK4-associating serine/arginine rich protein n=1 Tax=Senna tora TaxID=362788 RepID=A0A834TZ33_9FABA|nr:CLK4-associating serine/arginine rich protein [Senna tora]
MWHEARRSERKVHDMMDAARKRAQRRAVYLAKRRGDPQQSIQAIGIRCRTYRDDGLYQAIQDQQGLIPWNGKQDILIDRFDGRALLDFIRETGSRRVQEKSEEEEELEEFVNFERYRDLIKHRHRGFTDEEALLHVNQEMEAKAAAPFASDRWPKSPKTLVTRESVILDKDLELFPVNIAVDMHPWFMIPDALGYNAAMQVQAISFVTASYKQRFLFPGMEMIAKEYGVKRYGWLVYMDKKAKEEEKRQKEVIKGDPAIRKLSRKERRKASQIEREREREAARISGTRVLHHDPYREPRRSPTYEAYSRSRRSRSRSRSYSPSYSRRYSRSGNPDDVHRSKPRTPKIEYITEFGGSGEADEPKLEGFSPPPSPSQADKPSSGRILEALHVDPASGVSIDKDKATKVLKPSANTSSALAKLSKASASGGPLKQQQGEKKETPQERLKRIMNKQLNKQIKKDTAAELAKKREQERQRLEKLAETSRLSRYRRRSRSRSYSRSPPSNIGFMEGGNLLIVFNGAKDKESLKTLMEDCVNMAGKREFY